MSIDGRADEHYEHQLARGCRVRCLGWRVDSLLAGTLLGAQRHHSSNRTLGSLPGHFRAFSFVQKAGKHKHTIQPATWWVIGAFSAQKLISSTAGSEVVSDAPCPIASSVGVSS